MRAEVSVVTTAHADDTPPLADTIPRWRRLPRVREIVLVAWGPDAARDAARHAGPGVVPVPVAAGDGEPFAPGLARNLGVMAAAGDVILALDPDVAPRDLDAAFDALGRSGAFVTVASGPAGREGTQALVRREDWLAAGGQHEYLVGRGADGEEFAGRLAAAGLHHRFFGPGAIAALPGGGGVLPRHDPPPAGVPLPPGLWRDATFVVRRNRILAGLAPWHPALAALRPRRLGGEASPGAARPALLGPAPTLQRRLLDWASVAAARITGDAPEDALEGLALSLLESQAGAWRADAERQNQLARARARLGIHGPWR